MSSGRAPTPAGTLMFLYAEFFSAHKSEANNNGDMGVGQLWLKWVGAVKG